MKAAGVIAEARSSLRAGFRLTRDIAFASRAPLESAVIFDPSQCEEFSDGACYAVYSGLMAIKTNRARAANE